MERDFEQDKDYVLLTDVGKHSGRGGHNAKVYALTINCAERFSVSAETGKGREIRDFFVRVFDVIQDYHVLTLQIANKLAVHQAIHEALMKQYGHGKHVFYRFWVGKQGGKWELQKFGRSNRLFKRHQELLLIYGMALLADVIETHYNTELENAVKGDSLVSRYRITLVVKGENHTELVEIRGDLTDKRFSRLGREHLKKYIEESNSKQRHDQRMAQIQVDRDKIQVDREKSLTDREKNRTETFREMVAAGLTGKELQSCLSLLFPGTPSNIGKDQITHSLKISDVDVVDERQQEPEISHIVSREELPTTTAHWSSTAKSQARDNASINKIDDLPKDNTSLVNQEKDIAPAVVEHGVDPLLDGDAPESEVFAGEEEKKAKKTARIPMGCARINAQTGQVEKLYECVRYAAKECANARHAQDHIKLAVESGDVYNGHRWRTLTLSELNYVKYSVPSDKKLGDIYKDIFVGRYLSLVQIDQTTKAVICYHPSVEAARASLGKDVSRKLFKRAVALQTVFRGYVFRPASVEEKVECGASVNKKISDIFKETFGSDKSPVAVAKMDTVTHKTIAFYPSMASARASLGNNVSRSLFKKSVATKKKYLKNWSIRATK